MTLSAGGASAADELSLGTGSERILRRLFQVHGDEALSPLQPRTLESRFDAVADAPPVSSERPGRGPLLGPGVASIPVPQSPAGPASSDLTPFVAISPTQMWGPGGYAEGFRTSPDGVVSVSSASPLAPSDTSICISPTVAWHPPGVASSPASTEPPSMPQATTSTSPGQRISEVSGFGSCSALPPTQMWGPGGFAECGRDLSEEIDAVSCCSPLSLPASPLAVHSVVPHLATSVEAPLADLGLGLSALSDTVSPLPAAIEASQRCFKDQTVEDLKVVMGEIWGYTDFKHDQETIISSILRGHDIMGILPTGAGKTLCYALPSARLLLVEQRLLFLQRWP